jgi:hypothetical protein
MKGNYKRFTVIGHGGFSCSCCAPKSGNKYGARAIVIMKRQAKRREVVGLNKLNKGE